MKPNRTLLAAAVTGALVAGTVSYTDLLQKILPNAHAASEVATPTAYGLPDFTELVTRTSPAVVSVRVTETMPTSNRGMPPGLDPNNPYYEFFKRFGSPGGEGGEGALRQGEGSGFIISGDGYVVTNAHVVSHADDVMVLLADKRELKAKVVGVDETSDVAVLKLDASNLPSLKIGDANTLKVGEWVVAIGSPFGFDHTVSAGVVSAKGRSLPNGGYVPFIQTDVALNPGNSGGPLLNLRGEVVGVNSQIYSRSGGYMGLSFAIPIDLAMNVQAQLVQHGKVARGRLGVSVQAINQQLADSFGLPLPTGALVSGVLPGTAADKAGIKVGDVILKIDGKVIDEPGLLSRTIAEQKPGVAVALDIIRAGKPQSIAVKLGEAETSTIALADNDSDGRATGRLGAAVRALDTDMKRESGLDHGVLVERVAGPAARAGLRPGDVILAVNSEQVKDPATLQRAIAAAPKSVALLVKRDQAEIYIPIKLG